MGSKGKGKDIKKRSSVMTLRLAFMLKSALGLLRFNKGNKKGGEL